MGKPFDGNYNALLQTMKAGMTSTFWENISDYINAEIKRANIKIRDTRITSANLEELIHIQEEVKSLEEVLRIPDKIMAQCSMQITSMPKDENKTSANVDLYGNRTRSGCKT